MSSSEREPVVIRGNRIPFTIAAFPGTLVATSLDVTPCAPRAVPPRLLRPVLQTHLRAPALRNDARSGTLSAC